MLSPPLLRLQPAAAEVPAKDCGPQLVDSLVLKRGARGEGAKMAEEQDGENTFSPTNSSKEHLNVE